MARPLTPGAFRRAFVLYAARAEAASVAVITALAKATQEKAVDNLTRLSHPFGTATPATPGGPPAAISGTLADSIGITAPQRVAGGWAVRCGIESGAVPWYSHSRTPVEQYGRYLETGDTRNGNAWPWLQPAFDDAVRTGAVHVAQAFRRVV